MCKKIKIVIAGGPKLIRDGYISILKENPAFSIIGEAGNGKEAIEQLEQKEPDILILAIEMPVMVGFEALLIIKKRFPKVKIIILSMHDEAEIINYLFDIGTHSFLPKNCESQQLVEVIEIVHREGQYIPSDLAKRIENVTGNKSSANKFLNHAERNVIKLMCFGKRDKEIMEELNINTNSLKYHKDKIREKTGIETPAQFGAYGVKHGIVNIKDLRIK